MSIWVCPHCPKKSTEREIEKIEGLARLYAYPCEPRFENGGLVILDSGAFGLAQSGGKMNFAYMQKLSQHYEKYYRENMLCVAPDEFMNSVQSMMNFQKWITKGLFKNISPVLQSDNKGLFKEKDILTQAEFYREYTDTILWGSPKLTAKQAKALHIEKTFKKLKQMGFKWIHKLGAGWDIEDIKQWKEIECLDSFDSIAYYQTTFGNGDILQNVKDIMSCWRNTSEE